MDFERILITGSAGFIGSHLVRHWLEKPTTEEVIVIDKLGIGSDLFNLPFDDTKLKFHLCDLTNRDYTREVILSHKPDLVINLAAESHVDRSIGDGAPFGMSNVVGAINLLEACRDLPSLRKIIIFSTDEVYGQIDRGSFRENSTLAPRSPYSASKASQDLFADAYRITHNLPTIITRCANVYGPHQHNEKFIPTIIRSILKEEKVPVYGEGKQMREWIYVKDVCRALDTVSDSGMPGEIWHIGSGEERTNIDTASFIAETLGKQPQDVISFVCDRKAHDWRYSLDCGKLKSLGWRAETDFATGISATIKWFSQREKM